MALGNPHLLTSLRPTFLPPGLEALITPTKHQTPLLSSSAWAPQRLPLKESRPALFTVHNWHLLAVSSYGEKRLARSLGLIYKGTNPIHEGSTLMTLAPPTCLTS